MITCSFMRPKIYLSKAHNDMGSFYHTFFDVPDYFFLDVKDYIKLKEFSHFDTKEVAEEIKRYRKNKNVDINDVSEIDKFLYLPNFSRMNSLIKEAGGYQLYQFNAFSSDLEDYHRICLALGEKQLKRWNWIDEKVLLPFYKTLAIILNKLLYFYNIYEYKQWDNFKKGLTK